MFSKVAIVLAVIAVVYAGQEQPPPKVHTYNVNQVAKVQYPGPEVRKQVETYSAPSIEKTTTITRTITAPLNAPQGRTVAYASPSPIVKAHAPAVLAVPNQFAYAAAPAIAAAPVAYAAPQFAGYAHQAYAAPAYAGAVAAPGLAYQQYAAAPAHLGYAGNQFQTVYSSPSLGYSLGGAQVLAAAPVAAYAAAAPAAAVVKSAGY